MAPLRFLQADRLNRLNAVVNRVAEERAQRFLDRDMQARRLRGLAWRRAQHGNLPFRQHGLVGAFDAMLSRALLLARCPTGWALPPNPCRCWWKAPTPGTRHR